MKKTIYFIRHSEVLKGINNEFNNDSLQLNNEKSILSINGERLADEVSKLEEFGNIDLVVSSNYVRAISTAKYFVDRNNCPLVVTNLFSERKHGISSWDELPKDFEERQFNDFSFKIGNGESLNEVRDRMLDGLNKILESDVERVIVIGHATSIMSMFSTWCDVSYSGLYKFNEKVFFDGNWKYLESFKLEFVDNELVNISNLNI